MDIIKEITVEQATKNILVTYYNEELDNYTRKGFNPTIEGDWAAIDQDPRLSEYKRIAWAELLHLTEELPNVDEHE